MKTSGLFCICSLTIVVSCEDMNRPINSGGFDPLGAPGAGELTDREFAGPRVLRPGEFAVAAIDNTAFFNQRPGPEAEADKLLKRGTPMKIINTTGSFHRVELDSGEVGFVPSVMVESADAAPVDAPVTDASIDPISGAPFTEPTPPLPEGLPSDVIPDVQPGPGDVQPEPGDVQPEPGTAQPESGAN